MQRLRLAVAPLVALVLTSCASGIATTPSIAKSTQAKPAVLLASTGAWPTYHHDDAHTGYDPTQPNATGASAGWVSAGLDGTILAEPLVFGGMVYAATLQGTVYAINQSTGVVAWSTNVGTPTTWSGQCGNINPLGISGTPAIDTAANRIYVTENLATDSAWHVFAIDLSTHNVVMNSTIPSSLGTGLDWTIEQDRGALAVANGNVYVPFGGRIGDCGAYHGWIVAVPTSGAAVTNFYETPGQGAGFWASGGVVVDDTTGKVFETSGNGTGSGCMEVSTGGPPTFENDAVVRLSATLAHEDAFIPQDWHNNWCSNDQDLGSATMVLISPTLAFQAGKWGSGFLVNPQSLGGQDGQLFPTPKPAAYTEFNVCGGLNSDANFGSYSYAAPFVYLGCEGNGLFAWNVNTGTPSLSTGWSATGFHPGPPIVAGGAVWAVDTNGGGLYGFNATTGAQIYHSAAFGGVNHFATPSEAGGQIFVASSNVIRSFNMSVTACASVSASAMPGSPQSAGTSVTITGTASGCPNPLYEFWYLGQGSSSWQLVKSYSAGNTFTWNSTGALAGNHIFSVWARDAGSSGTHTSSLGSYDAFGNTTYVISTPSCASVTASASPASPQPASTAVTVTGSASGCSNPSPLYEIWYLGQGSSTWQLVKGYSTTATFNWNSTGAAAGNHIFSVWVRDAASSGLHSALGSTYDAYGNTTFVITVQTCASVTATAAPASPQASGTAVTITATASGCSNPRYEFWILAPGGSWTIAQPYSATNTFNWTTTGLPAGVYRYSVWVRDASSSASYDAFFPGTTYTLT